MESVVLRGKLHISKDVCYKGEQVTCDRCKRSNVPFCASHGEVDLCHSCYNAVRDLTVDTTPSSGSSTGDTLGNVARDGKLYLSSEACATGEEVVCDKCEQSGTPFFAALEEKDLCYKCFNLMRDEQRAKQTKEVREARLQRQADAPKRPHRYRMMQALFYQGRMEKPKKKKKNTTKRAMAPRHQLQITAMQQRLFDSSGK